MSATCLLEIEFTLKPEKRREFNRSVEDLRSLEGEGHLRTAVYEDRELTGHMIWISDWRDRTTLNVYIQSDSFRVLLGGLTVLGTVLECRLVDGSGSCATPSTSSERVMREMSFFEVGPKKAD
jgi:quinol monooxygenase YgiN